MPLEREVVYQMTPEEMEKEARALMLAGFH